MSGIAGWIDYHKDLRNETGIADAMSAAIRHRGNVCGGVDITPASVLISRQNVPCHDGKQPMKKSVGGEQYSIVFDGVIFNAGEIRSQLNEKGISFFGHSDAELVLNAYIEFGAECLQRLNGAFAFVIYAAREKTLFAARDRIGIKPFYYHVYKDGLLFASEIKALFCNPICRPILDNDGLKQIFLLGPGKPMGSGIYRKIHELCQAEYLFYSKSGLKIKKYWTIEAKENRETLAQAVEHTRALVEDAINLQIAPNTAPACFLSGGLDSSIISYVVAKRLRQENKTLHTLSLDYENHEQFFQRSDFQPERDSEYIHAMQQFIGSHHALTVLKTQDVCDALVPAVLARDIPGMADIDSAMLVACGEVKKQYDTVFSGECADELFGGYPWYHRPELFDADTFPWSRSLDLRKGIVKEGLLGYDTQEYVYAHYENTVRSASVLDTDSQHEKRVRQIFMLNFEWFMQNLLDRTERMSMQYGLDVRVPFCDYRIVEYAYNLPWALKSVDGREKGILRKAFRGILPDVIIDRKKSPFPKTFDPAYLAYVKKAMQNILDDSKSPLNALIRTEYVQSLLSQDPYAADPWYGQLMRLPQVFAYLVQVNALLCTYDVRIV